MKKRFKKFVNGIPYWIKRGELFPDHNTLVLSAYSQGSATLNPRKV